jgi:hypothetical protein
MRSGVASAEKSRGLGAARGKRAAPSLYSVRPTSKERLMPYTLILADGERHEVKATFRFAIIKGQKFPEGEIDGDPAALAAAFSEGSTTLETPSGKQYRVAVDAPRGKYRFRGL